MPEAQSQPKISIKPRKNAAEYPDNSYTRALEKARVIIGGYQRIGNLFGISYKAVVGWRNRGKPPRSEYTGETNYAEVISEATQGKVKKKDLLPKLS